MNVLNGFDMLSDVIWLKIVMVFGVLFSCSLLVLLLNEFCSLKLIL